MSPFAHVDAAIDFDEQLELCGFQVLPHPYTSPALMNKFRLNMQYVHFKAAGTLSPAMFEPEQRQHSDLEASAICLHVCGVCRQVRQ